MVKYVDKVAVILRLEFMLACISLNFSSMTVLVSLELFETFYSICRNFSNLASLSLP